MNINNNNNNVPEYKYVTIPNDTSCSICQYELIENIATIDISEKTDISSFQQITKENETPVMTKCSHYFHASCIGGWANTIAESKKTTFDCPNCRHILANLEVSPSNNNVDENETIRNIYETYGNDSNAVENSTNLFMQSHRPIQTSRYSNIGRPLYPSNSLSNAFSTQPMPFFGPSSDRMSHSSRTSLNNNNNNPETLPQLEDNQFESDEEQTANELPPNNNCVTLSLQNGEIITMEISLYERFGHLIPTIFQTNSNETEIEDEFEDEDEFDDLNPISLGNSPDDSIDSSKE